MRVGLRERAAAADECHERRHQFGARQVALFRRISTRGLLSASGAGLAKHFMTRSGRAVPIVEAAIAEVVAAGDVATEAGRELPAPNASLVRLEERIDLNLNARDVHA